MWKQEYLNLKRLIHKYRMQNSVMEPLQTTRNPVQVKNQPTQIIENAKKQPTQIPESVITFFVKKFAKKPEDFDVFIDRFDLEQSIQNINNLFRKEFKLEPTTYFNDENGLVRRYYNELQQASKEARQSGGSFWTSSIFNLTVASTGIYLALKKGFVRNLVETTLAPTIVISLTEYLTQSNTTVFQELILKLVTIVTIFHFKNMPNKKEKCLNYTISLSVYAFMQTFVPNVSLATIFPESTLNRIVDSLVLEGQFMGYSQTDLFNYLFQQPWIVQSGLATAPTYVVQGIVALIEKYIESIGSSTSPMVV